MATLANLNINDHFRIEESSFSGSKVTIVSGYNHRVSLLAIGDQRKGLSLYPRLVHQNVRMESVEAMNSGSLVD